MSDKEKSRDYWSGCEQVLFHYGQAYGLTDSLETIQLGKEEDILKAFETGGVKENLKPDQQEVLMAILENRKENGFGIREADMVGTSDDGAIRSAAKETRLSTPRKRIALRSSHQKHKSLFRR